MTDEDLANDMASLIYSRTQLTQGDAEDLAWDLLTLVRDRI